MGRYCGTRPRISGTSVVDTLSGPRFGCREAPCTSRGRDSSRELIWTRYRPVLATVLPTPCASFTLSDMLISEHRHPFCEPEHPSVAGNAPTRYIHTPARHGNPPQRVTLPYWDGQCVCTSLNCLQSPTGRVADIPDTPHFSGVPTDFKLK